MKSAVQEKNGLGKQTKLQGEGEDTLDYEKERGSLRKEGCG